MLLHDNDIKRLAHRFIFLPMTRTVLERDQQKIKHANLKVPFPLLQLIDGAITNITKDLRDTKKEMQKIGLTVYDQKSDYLIVCKGYQQHLSYSPDAIRRHVTDTINHYLGGL